MRDSRVPSVVDRRLCSIVPALLLAAILVGCATTTRSTLPRQETWTARDSTSRAPDLGSEAVPVYVVGFGLSSQVASRYPGLADNQVGFGICNRIVEALFDTGRFRFIEEKAEVVDTMVDLMRTGREIDPASIQPEVSWLLYGEVVDLQVAIDEKAAGVVGSTTRETRMVVQVRLVERATGEFYPATGTGVYRSRVTDWRPGTPIEDLEPSDVGAATDEAVRAAVGRLVAELPAGGA